MKTEKQSTSPSSPSPHRQQQQQQQPYLSKSPTKLLFNLLAPPISLLQLVPYLLLFASGVALGFTLSFSLKQHFLQFNPLSTNRQSLSSKNLTSPTSHQHLPPPPPSPPPPPPPTASISTTSQTGVKRSFDQPDVSHHMDDEELLWRASMIPRIREYPFRRVPKVAFMFLVRGWVPLSPLWDEFFHGHEGKYSVYVHLTPGSKWTAPATSAFNGRNIPSQAVNWGQFNMIEAERRLLANALLDVSNSRFVLLSESCIPIFNFTTVYDYLTGSKKSFVGSMDEPGATGRGRYNPQMRPTITINQWRKGSQWFEMDRELAIEVVSDKTYVHLFRKFCKGSCYSDEHYLPTLVTTKYSRMNSNRSLTWVDWSRGGPHPVRFVRTDVSIEFLKRLRSGSTCEYNANTTGVCFLFARKFTPNSLDRLLRFAPKESDDQNRRSRRNFPPNPINGHDGEPRHPTTHLNPIKIEIMMLDGGFPSNDRNDWTSKEFNRNIVREREGKRPLLAGELRLITVENATYKKHYPPSLNNQVWRLEKIGEERAEARCDGHVQDFLKLSVANLDDGFDTDTMSEKMWEVMIKHARTCEMCNNHYIYRGHDFDIMLNLICQVERASINGHLYSTRDLPNVNRPYIVNLDRQAYSNWSLLEETEGAYRSRSHNSPLAILRLLMGIIKYPSSGINDYSELKFH